MGCSAGTCYFDGIHKPKKHHGLLEETTAFFNGERFFVHFWFSKTTSMNAEFGAHSINDGVKFSRMFCSCKLLLIFLHLRSCKSAWVK